MKNVILTPNPYRDRNFATVRSAMQILKETGLRVSLCLPFEVDRSFELPKDLRFSRLDRELPNADAIICFGGISPSWASISARWASWQSWKARRSGVFPSWPPGITGWTPE